MTAARKIARTLPFLAAGYRYGGSSPAPALLRPTLPLPLRCHFSSEKAAEGGGINGKKRSLARSVVSIAVISVAGGVALSAINDLAIFHGCSSKAIEKAAENPKVVEAIGLPIVRGPWYDASLAVGHRRRSVSCTFPVSGPHGSGIFQVKAIRNGEDGLLSFLRHHDWEILIMEAFLHVRSDDDRPKTVRINLTNSSNHSSMLSDCNSCPLGESEQREK